MHCTKYDSNLCHLWSATLLSWYYRFPHIRSGARIACESTAMEPGFKQAALQRQTLTQWFLALAASESYPRSFKKYGYLCSSHRDHDMLGLGFSLSIRIL